MRKKDFRGRRAAGHTGRNISSMAPSKNNALMAKPPISKLDVKDILELLLEACEVARYGRTIDMVPSEAVRASAFSNPSSLDSHILTRTNCTPDCIVVASFPTIYVGIHCCQVSTQASGTQYGRTMKNDQEQIKTRVCCDVYMNVKS